MGTVDLIKNKYFIDENTLSNVLYLLNSIDELRKEDSEYFMGMLIFGIDKCDNSVRFKNATSIYFNVIYCGNLVADIFENYSECKEYPEYVSQFKMVKEKNGDYSFCCRVELNGTDAVSTLNKAFKQMKIKRTAKRVEKSIYISLR